MSDDTPEIPAGCLSVVVPAYNEGASIAEILRLVEARPEVGEIVVVDDGSGDDTCAVVEGLGLKKLNLIRQGENQGKGAAVRRGMQEARCDYVVIQDADLEYEPGDYPSLLAPLIAGQAGACYGNRFHDGQPARMSPLYYLANRALSLYSNILTGYRLGDMETCYKVFPRELVDRLELREDRFGFEPEVTAELARLGVRLAQVPIAYHPRTREEGKKIGWRDGVRALLVITRSAFRRGRRAGGKPKS